MCHLLGDYLESIHKDFEKARKVFQSTCDDYGYAKSCLKYGNYTFVGRGKSGAVPNPTEALSYYEKGCKLGDSENCLNSGLLLISPKLDTRRDFPKVIFQNTLHLGKSSKSIRSLLQGVEYLTKSCDLNNANACFYLSGMHISGAQGPSHPKPSDTEPLKSSTQKAQPSATTVTNATDYVIEKNMEKAFAFTYKACELKNVYACANLSQMYARGEGTEKNAEKAEKFKKLVYDLEEQSKSNKAQLIFSQGT